MLSVVERSLQVLPGSALSGCAQFFAGQTFKEWVDVSFRGGSRNGSKHSAKCAYPPLPHQAALPKPVVRGACACVCCVKAVAQLSIGL